MVNTEELLTFSDLQNLVENEGIIVSPDCKDIMERVIVHGVMLQKLLQKENPNKLVTAQNYWKANKKNIQDDFVVKITRPKESKLISKFISIIDNMIV